MKRICLVVVASLFYCSGCTHEPEQSAPEKSSAVTESVAPAKPANEDTLPMENNVESKSSDAEEGSDDAMALYRQAQALMKEGKFEEGHEVAEKAMAQFIAENDDLTWMLLEVIEVEGKRLEVHFNMGGRERKMPADGIVRPLSFRIWSGEDASELSQTLDFEIGRMDGQSVTAAIGERTESGHNNYGILEVDSPYETIRQRVIDIISQN